MDLESAIAGTHFAEAGGIPGWVLEPTLPATGVAIPTDEDIQRVINHFMYRNFMGDFRRPLFNNFFDGSNGWYRVGYTQANTGYAPAQSCDAKSSVDGFRYMCLFNPGALMGWGLLASLNEDLMGLQHSLLKLAWSQESELIEFRDRSYWYAGRSFSPRDANGNIQYPPSVLWVLGGIPERLR